MSKHTNDSISEEELQGKIGKFAQGIAADLIEHNAMHIDRITTFKEFVKQYALSEQTNILEKFIQRLIDVNALNEDFTIKQLNQELRNLQESKD